MTSTASTNPAFSSSRHLPAEITPRDPPASIAKAMTA
jgi:hypothetical protein